MQSKATHNSIQESVSKGYYERSDRNSITFSEALELLKQGKKVTRTSYQQKAQYSKQLPEITTLTQHWELIKPTCASEFPYLVSLFDTKLTGADLCAIDWEEYNPSIQILAQPEDIEKGFRLADRVLRLSHIKATARTPIWNSKGQLTDYEDRRTIEDKAEQLILEKEIQMIKEIEIL